MVTVMMHTNDSTTLQEVKFNAFPGCYTFHIDLNHPETRIPGSDFSLFLRDMDAVAEFVGRVNAAWDDLVNSYKAEPVELPPLIEHREPVLGHSY